MKPFLDARWLSFTCVVLLASCATTTRVETLNASYAAREGDCEIAFFNGARPSVPFETIGKIESHIAQNVFFGGKAKLEDEGYDELRKKACGIGGNGVIIDDHILTSATEMTHLHLWATVIRVPAKN